MLRPAAFVPALVAAVALAFGGCGEDDAALLPGSTAREITANLDAVEQLADEGDCAGAESAALQVGEQVEALQDVDPRLRRALVEGAERLEEVVARCEEEPEVTEPLPDELEAEEEEAAEQLEKEEEREEKEQEEREKEEEKRDESDEVDDEGSPSLPPQAEGEGKGPDDEGDEAPSGGEGEPSGGVSPANPAGEG